jgi:hypothetical protein
MNSRYIIGSLFLFYGIVKVTIILCLKLLPEDKIKKIPILNIFASASSDKTLAGEFYEYVLFLYAIYSLFEGLALLDQLPLHLIHFIETKQ